MAATCKYVRMCNEVSSMRAYACIAWPTGDGVTRRIHEGSGGTSLHSWRFSPFHHRLSNNAWPGSHSRTAALAACSQGAMSAVRARDMHVYRVCGWTSWYSMLALHTCVVFDGCELLHISSLACHAVWFMPGYTARCRAWFQLKLG